MERKGTEGIKLSLSDVAWALYDFYPLRAVPFSALAPDQRREASSTARGEQAMVCIVTLPVAASASGNVFLTLAHVTSRPRPDAASTKGRGVHGPAHAAQVGLHRRRG